MDRKEIIKVNPDAERLLAYSAGILGSILANPNNTYTAESLIGTSVRAASKLIDTIFNEESLRVVLEQQ